MSVYIALVAALLVKQNRVQDRSGQLQPTTMDIQNSNTTRSVCIHPQRRMNNSKNSTLIS